jgi:uncharacterized membrane protein
MIRKILFHPINHDKFRFRGNELFRIEALSDAVFAFSVSLLVASLEVPQTFTELKMITAGAIPFFLTVTLVFLFWYQQYIFFRRYGLNDLVTIVLNLAYLAVVIFYVYPLKFLFSLLISSWMDIDLFAEANEKGLVVLSAKEFPQLIILFSIGYFLVWFIIYLLHRHILHLSKAFAFTPFEKLFTQKEVWGALWNALVGLLALTFAFFNYETLAGICYLFIPLILIVNQYVFKTRIKKIVKN